VLVTARMYWPTAGAAATSTALNSDTIRLLIPGRQYICPVALQHPV
jgi:hypothetical protein